MNPGPLATQARIILEKIDLGSEIDPAHKPLTCWMRRGYVRIYRILDSSNLKKKTKTAKAEFRVDEINGTKETHLYEWFIIRIRIKQKPNKKSGSFLSLCSWPVQVNMDLGGTWAQLRCL